LKYIAAIFSLALFLTGCQKRYSFETIIITQAPAPAPTDDSNPPGKTIFFDAVINGKHELHISLENGYSNYWSSGVSYADNSFGMYEQGIESSSGNSSLIFSRGVIRLMHSDTSLLLKNKRKIAGFQPGNYVYTKDPGTNSGVILRWRDENGKTWSTDYGTALQPGGSFSITKVQQEITNANSTMVNGVIIDCSFTCTLYDNSGQSMTVKNGRMRISVWL
jgi:hypothetical protein